VAEPEKTASDAAQRQAEYKFAKDFCDNKGPRQKPGQNYCSYLSEKIDHAEQCIALYEEWDNKWLKGRHADKIQTWKNRVNKAKAEHKRKCINNL